jgi:diguanylate cyclase (GGDEF)-like protein
MRLAFKDDLTGLYNRAMLIDRLRYLMTLSKRQQMSMALFYLDLDGFKNINDVYGHQVGDDVLKQTADKLRHIFRESDTLARMGGDEFVIVTQNVGVEDAGMLAQKCIDAMASAWTVNDQALEGLSASVGVALFQSGDETDIADLINHADGAMYRAKNNGKNRYFVYR